MTSTSYAIELRTNNFAARLSTLLRYKTMAEQMCKMTPSLYRQLQHLLQIEEHPQHSDFGGPGRLWWECCLRSSCVARRIFCYISAMFAFPTNRPLPFVVNALQANVINVVRVYWIKSTMYEPLFISLKC